MPEAGRRDRCDEEAAGKDDLDALAREAALSAFHFQRVFRGLVREMPLELHRRPRVERAAERVCRTRAGVAAIAFDAGYDTHEAFTRAFGQRYGTSPSAFRERAADAASACHGGPPTELAARCGLHVRDGRFDLGAPAPLPGGASSRPVGLESEAAWRPSRRLNHTLPRWSESGLDWRRSISGTIRGAPPWSCSNLEFRLHRASSLRHKCRTRGGSRGRPGRTRNRDRDNPAHPSENTLSREHDSCLAHFFAVAPSGAAATTDRVGRKTGG